ncbi:SU10 major capsid protein [Oryzomonas rubra]|uniref:Uncharacterized protein n=1 Tax=Oryzomonas rubra TaxID=2509454 RepID=A0A5A9X8F5_9BACT|nr:hypothetical protein [Oryzomonas rubra]KAA0888758.1 hypothetical protein ET418_15370 [Oryzomonas rubra]
MVLSYDQILKSAGMEITGDDRVEDLRKALYSTQSGAASGSSAGPLMLENLDSVMTEVLYTEKHFKVYNYLPKVPSAQAYYQYNKHTGYGSNRAGGAGFAEGGAPQGRNSTFSRNGVYTKYLGVQGGVTHQMLVAGQNGGVFEDPNVRENRDRTLELLEKIERELVFGQAAIQDGNGVEVNFDGLLTSLMAQKSSNVIDMQGKPLGFSNLDESALSLVTTGKQPSVDGYICLSSAHVKSGLNKQFAAANMVRMNKDTATGQVYTPGTAIDKYDTEFGTMQLDHSILLQEVDGGVPATVALANSPAIPAITTQPAATADAASTLFAGTYYYSVAAFNDVGESLPVVCTAVAPTAGQRVTIVITRTTGATGYRIYRGLAADGSDAKWIAKVAQTAAGNLTFVDQGAWKPLDVNGKPGDGIAILFKPNPADIAIAQMTPLIKMPLPQVGTIFPFLLLVYMVSVLKAPERLIIYKNCGTYPTA